MIIRKAVVYITRLDGPAATPQLLVFDHVDHPAAGTQVPAGTVDDGEAVAAAALREAYEETGLEGIRLVAALGIEDVDLRPYGVEATARRHFFHAVVDAGDGVDAVDAVDGARRERWRHVEAHGVLTFMQSVVRWASAQRCYNATSSGACFTALTRNTEKPSTLPSSSTFSIT